MQVLEFSNLAPYLLHENGNRLYKLPIGDGWAVLKIYSRTRSILQQCNRSLANLLAGQTSYFPKKRCSVERDCLELWRRSGFQVFERLENLKIVARDCASNRYLLTRYVAAPKLSEFLSDGNIPQDERLGVYRNFLGEWSRRHDLAIAKREPRLVHENGNCKHVLVTDQGFLWFDFEMCYRSRTKVSGYISREIVNYLRHLKKDLPPQLYDRLLEETIRLYPVKARLAGSYEFLFRNPNHIHRWCRALDRLIGAQAKKPASKYNVATEVVRRLSNQQV